MKQKTRILIYILMAAAVVVPGVLGVLGVLGVPPPPPQAVSVESAMAAVSRQAAAFLYSFIP